MGSRTMRPTGLRTETPQLSPSARIYLSQFLNMETDFYVLKYTNSCTSWEVGRPTRPELRRAVS